ncbi:aspartate-semialdehyde dehydrogenase [Vagococcus penaei]|uniref:Aspartate-semialdehyde dehydrogenase n=1 Tax=Vagococcus penaei TaxID=633807 RepID=A0A1Q2D5E0_9ENTE|nr:aspartate-semialdehyde dehydrogenase [Vagococcus penaei]AQP53501.1 aspartate-semialdehyde dehydrogenase [Vagococcus penaei]RSU07446.1 aspartate-semialdehyde dehydrogenase [Vagococcus penaei]
MTEYVIAVVGATGAVGKKMIEILENSSLPLKKVVFLASKRSVGKQISFQGQIYQVEELTPESFNGVDIALFSAGGAISERYAQEAVNRGAVVIDNTSAFRMHSDVPLVVPEVNEAALAAHRGIIANPNCSTIQMMVALDPIRQAYGLERIIVSTYQAVSGAGAEAIEEMTTQAQAMLNHEPVPTPEILPCGSDKRHYPLAFNVLAQIDEFSEAGYTLEEWKMMNETKKIMADNQIKVAATCVRVPVMTGHSESVFIQLKHADVSVKAIQELLTAAPGVTVQDDPSQQIYPQPLTSVDLPDVFVGRIRKDLDDAYGIHLWIVSDNLIKGAAWNSIQIAESLHRLDLVRVSDKLGGDN